MQDSIAKEKKWDEKNVWKFVPLQGGSSPFITILHGGGVSRDPKFVLRNVWTAPNRENKTQGKVFSYTKSLLMLCGFSVY